MTAVGILVAIVATVLAFAGLGMTGHMAAHMSAVAVAAPVLAFGLPLSSAKSVGVRGRQTMLRSWLPLTQPSSRGEEGGSNSPLLWAAVEFAIVWAWHVPALRDVADMSVAVALLEQAMFLGVGVMLWRAAFAQPAAGVAALLLTSMHMTLLGALIGLAPRPLYAMMAMHPAPGLDALADQQLGGVVMLLVGGASYCLGGLWLLSTLLRKPAT
ncbi:cytochrome c oxidase assembly protein [Sphingomonas sp. Leaf412]|uniref:cytochrome c oxidase assembly protein n=1 Tax=Sphingomonas sp. Leaf412 TaxID=1736370 RepID=UPI000AC9398D|nr:cytochrome c oxidase assembly protein [Sphingomonas sp. Leaf412]